MTAAPAHARTWRCAMLALVATVSAGDADVALAQEVDPDVVTRAATDEAAAASSSGVCAPEVAAIESTITELEGTTRAPGRRRMVARRLEALRGELASCVARVGALGGADGALSDVVPGDAGTIATNEAADAAAAGVCALEVTEINGAVAELHRTTDEVARDATVRRIDELRERLVACVAAAAAADRRDALLGALGGPEDALSDVIPGATGGTGLRARSGGDRIVAAPAEASGAPGEPTTGLRVMPGVRPPEDRTHGLGAALRSMDATPPPPDVVIVGVSGHDAHDVPYSGEYLGSYHGFASGRSTVDALQEAFEAHGLGVERILATDNYLTPDPNARGFVGLVAELERVRADYVPRGTRVVVVGHSHGTVWSHLALLVLERRGAPLAVEVLIDLDGTSLYWEEDGPGAVVGEIVGEIAPLVGAPLLGALVPRGDGVGDHWSEAIAGADHLCSSRAGAPSTPALPDAASPSLSRWLARVPGLCAARGWLASVAVWPFPIGDAADSWPVEGYSDQDVEDVVPASVVLNLEAWSSAFWGPALWQDRDLNVRVGGTTDEILQVEFFDAHGVAPLSISPLRHAIYDPDSYAMRWVLGELASHFGW